MGIGLQMFRRGAEQGGLHRGLEDALDLLRRLGAGLGDEALNVRPPASDAAAVRMRRRSSSVGRSMATAFLEKPGRRGGAGKQVCPCHPTAEMSHHERPLTAVWRPAGRRAAAAAGRCRPASAVRSSSSASTRASSSPMRWRSSSFSRSASSFCWRRRRRLGELRVVGPPVDPHLAGLVHRRDQQTDLDRQEFDIEQAD